MPFWRGLREQCFGTRKKAAHKEKWRSVDPEFKLPWARYQSCILALLIEKGVIRLQFSVLIVTILPGPIITSITIAINPFTAKCDQRQISSKFQNFIFYNFDKQIASCESTGRELSFEW